MIEIICLHCYVSLVWGHVGLLSVFGLPRHGIRVDVT